MADDARFYDSKTRRPWSFALFGAALPLLAGCDVPAPPHSTPGVDLTSSSSSGGGGTVDCPRGIVVVNSDYQSTNVSLLAPSGDVLSSSFISSASTTAGLSAPLSGDVVPSGTALPGKETVLIDRYPAGVLTFVDLETAKVRAQLRVGTGYGANLHDYVEVAPNEAFVARFEPNLASGEEPLDKGSDVLVIDPGVPSVLRRIDLDAAMAGEPSTFYPHPDKLFLDGGRVIALLSAYSVDYTSSASSRLVVIDVERKSIEQVLVLDGLHGCGAMAGSPDGSELAVACAGEFAGDSIPTLKDSGIVRVKLDAVLSEVSRYPAVSLGEGPLSLGLSYASTDVLVLTTLGRFAFNDMPATDDTALSLDLKSGHVTELLRSADDPFTLGDVRCAADCGYCFLADAGRNVVHRWTVGPAGLEGRKAITVDTAIGLPPRNLGVY